jgi:hypothetical protein
MALLLGTVIVTCAISASRGGPELTETGGAGASGNAGLAGPAPCLTRTLSRPADALRGPGPQLTPHGGFERDNLLVSALEFVLRLSKELRPVGTVHPWL